jgi:hypothetical protein
MSLRSIVVESTPNSTTDKRLLDLYAYWQALRRGDSIPFRKDFRPAAVSRLLPSILLIDVLNNPRDFRFRLAGNDFLTATGQELTGRLIGEVFPPEFRQDVFERWNAVVENGGPNWGRGKLWIKERDFMNWQGVVLPLRAEDGSVHQLLGAAAFEVGHS